MYVFFKFGIAADNVRVISNVTIGEDCVPVVNGEPINYDSAYEEEEATNNNNTNSADGGSIDAICWFKSLSMQAVYIDCSTRDARWCAKTVTIRDTRRQESVQLRRHQVTYHSGRKQDDTVIVDVPEETSNTVGACSSSLFMPASARPVFWEQPGMASFNPVIDEMFERVEKLCVSWDALKESKQINREVARILHCYIFPAVTFQKQDIPVLQECLRLIIVKHENIQRELLAKEKHIDVTDRYLARLKDVILTREDLGSQSYLQACSAQFVEVLYVQVTKDIQSSNMTLDILQTKVNDLKKSGQDAELLDRVKKERDELYTSMQKLLIVREAIRNHLYRPFVPKKKSRKRKVKIDEKDASLHTNFQMVYQQLVVDKDLMKLLCYRKLHFTSMREAIESTIRMLHREHPTSLGDFTEFSIKAISDRENEKSWKSMQGRVDGWMEREGTLSQLHLKGCQLIRDLVEGMLSDCRISLIGLETCLPGATHLETVQSGTSHAPVGGDVSLQRAPMVQMIMDQALAHMWDMAEKIAIHMKLDASPESRHLNRAWMCYDPHFWRESGKVIESIYTHYHAPQAREVHQQASSAALADIMDSHFFQKLFSSAEGGVSETSEQRSPSTVGRLHSQDSVLALSLDLQRCSVTDLYALANRDGAKVQCHMADLGDFILSIPGGGEGSFHSCSNKEATTRGNGSGESDSSAESGIVLGIVEGGEEDKARTESVSTCSKQSHDLTRKSTASADKTRIRSSHTVSSVLGVFNTVIEPYHQKIQDVLRAPSLMEKMRAVWKSVEFLSKKTQEVCHDQGMDSLLPMSIFATASFPEDLFVRYFVQLLILLDLKPEFTLHSIYDFSLSSAISTFMFLFETRFTGNKSLMDRS